MSSEIKKIIKNFSFLSIIQVLSLVIPFVYYPYLIRIFGSELFGKIVYAQSVALIAIIFIDFGFNLSAVKYVSVNRNDKEKLSEILSSVVAIKLSIFVFLGLVLVFVLNYTSILPGEKYLYYFSYINAFGSVLFIQWFFQGIEKVSIAAIISIIFKAVMLFFIFTIIKDDSDQYVFLIIFGSCNVIIGISSIVYAVSVFRLKLSIPKLHILLIHVKDSYAFFLSRISGAITLRLPSILIGNFIGMSYVAYYDLAEKLLNLMLLPINMINQVIYPNVSKNKRMDLVVKAIFLSLVFSFIMLVFSYFLAEHFIAWYAGQDMIKASDILCTIIWLVPINAINYFIGNCVLIVMGREKAFNSSVFFGLIIISVYTYSIILSNNENAVLFVIVTLISSTSILLFRLYHCLKIEEFKESLKVFTKWPF